MHCTSARRRVEVGLMALEGPPRGPQTSGSLGPDVVALAVRALTLYSLAEVQSGHASTIRVAATGTSFSVGDDGRGHAIGRSVDGTPYLSFIYTHLDYPFAVGQGGPVQLQGIGLSLLNSLCCELSVVVRKADETLRMSYRSGRLCDEARTRVTSGSTGTTVSGTVDPGLQRGHTDSGQIQAWLVAVLSAQPRLEIHFNGKHLGANPRSTA